MDSYFKLHGMKGVSDLKPFNEYLCSTGRDGTFRELDLVDGKFRSMSTQKLPMDWAANIIETEMYGLLIAGFHDVSS